MRTEAVDPQAEAQVAVRGGQGSQACYQEVQPLSMQDVLDPLCEIRDALQIREVQLNHLDLQVSPCTPITSAGNGGLRKQSARLQHPGWWQWHPKFCAHESLPASRSSDATAFRPLLVLRQASMTVIP